MTGPFNNPNVDETGFYVPFYFIPFGPAPAEPLASQFATVIVKPRGGQRPEAMIVPLRRAVSKADANLPRLRVRASPFGSPDAAMRQVRPW